jgi:hypothetical protein
MIDFSQGNCGWIYMRARGYRIIHKKHINDTNMYYNLQVSIGSIKPPISIVIAKISLLVVAFLY